MERIEVAKPAILVSFGKGEEERRISAEVIDGKIFESIHTRKVADFVSSSHGCEKQRTFSQNASKERTRAARRSTAHSLQNCWKNRERVSFTQVNRGERYPTSREARI